MTRRHALIVVAAIAAIIGFVGLVVRGNDPAEPRRHTHSYRSSRQAAVRVAARFLSGMDAATLLDDDARRTFVARWASRRTEPALQRLYDGEASRMAPLEGGYSRAAMVGYRVDRLAKTVADVTLWGVSLASVGDLPAAVGWRTLTVHLVVENGAWRIADVREVPGPSPESKPAALRRGARRFEEFRVAP